MLTIRPEAVAGMFYPDDTETLRRNVDRMLDAAETEGAAPKALIVPHAGYIYSGPVAASAYARLKSAHSAIRRVVLLGPSHRVGFIGIASSSAEAFNTPLGEIPLDRASIDQAETLPQVHRLDQAHQMEHSLEVQLPFLQRLIDEFTLVPLVVGDSSHEEVAEVLDLLWGGSETLLVISTDLSHYHNYNDAQARDRQTTAAIEQMQPERIGYDDACGRTPLNGLLQVARERKMRITTLDLRNSGDTAGDKSRVVGYGAYAVEEGADVIH